MDTGEPLKEGREPGLVQHSDNSGEEKAAEIFMATNVIFHFPIQAWGRRQAPARDTRAGASSRGLHAPAHTSLSIPFLC